MNCLKRLSRWPGLSAAHALCKSSMLESAQGPDCSFVRRNSTDSEAITQSKGQRLFDYWQSLLGNVNHTNSCVSTGGHPKPGWQIEDIRDLLHTAIRVRQGRVSGVLPEQLMSTFVQVYQKAMNPEDRLKLFQLLCQDFGVQGKSSALPLKILSQFD